MPISKIRFSYSFINLSIYFATSGVAMVNVDTADCHILAGMTGEIQMAS